MKFEIEMFMEVCQCSSELQAVTLGRCQINISFEALKDQPMAGMRFFGITWLCAQNTSKFETILHLKIMLYP